MKEVSFLCLWPGLRAPSGLRDISSSHEGGVCLGALQLGVAGTLPHALLGPEHTKWPPAWPWSLRLSGQFGELGRLV